MQKRNLILTTILSIFLISFTSAYNYGNSLGGFFSNIDSETVFILVTFIVTFAILNFALRKFFKEERSTPAIISFAIAFFAAYSLNRYDFYYNTGPLSYYIDDITYKIQELGFVGFIIIASLTIWFFYLLYKELAGNKLKKSKSE